MACSYAAPLKESFQSYQEELEFRNRKYALEHGVSTEQADAESFDTTYFSRIEVSGEKLLRGIDSYVSNRDKTWLRYLYFCEKQSDKRKKKFRRGEPPISFAEDLYATVPRKVLRYVVEEKKDGVGTLTCQEFCSSTRLMLDFKRLFLRESATEKRHALCWLGIAADFPKELQPEDYWFYEQQTGVNLAVELSACLDRCFSVNSGNAEVKKKKNQDIIRELLCICIKNNYPFIACVPALDWKTHAMKYACEFIANIFIDVLCGKQKEHELDCAARELLTIMHLKTKPSREQEQRIVLLQCKFISLFNQILNAFVGDVLNGKSILGPKADLENIKNWLTMDEKAPIVREDKPELAKEFKWHFNSYIDHFTDEEIRSQLNWYDENKTQIFGIQRGGRNMLTFCNTNDVFVKEYANVVEGFLRVYEADVIRGDGRSQSEVLRDRVDPRGKPHKRFSAFQKAIEQAVEYNWVSSKGTESK